MDHVFFEKNYFVGVHVTQMKSVRIQLKFESISNVHLVKISCGAIEVERTTCFDLTNTFICHFSSSFKPISLDFI